MSKSTKVTYGLLVLCWLILSIEAHTNNNSVCWMIFFGTGAVSIAVKLTGDRIIEEITKTWQSPKTAL
jgi:hypothetical protein